MNCWQFVKKFCPNAVKCKAISIKDGAVRIDSSLQEPYEEWMNTATDHPFLDIYDLDEHEVQLLESALMPSFLFWLEENLDALEFVKFKDQNKPK